MARMNDLQLNRTLLHVTDRQRLRAAYAVCDAVKGDRAECVALLAMIGLVETDSQGHVFPTVGERGDAPWR